MVPYLIEKVQHGALSHSHPPKYHAVLAPYFNVLCRDLSKPVLVDDNWYRYLSIGVFRLVVGSFSFVQASVAM